MAMSKSLIRKNGGDGVVSERITRCFRVLALTAIIVLPGCAQGRGNWPTLASALGWGADRETGSTEMPQPSVRTAAERGASDLTAWSQTAPVAAPLAPVAAPPPPPSAYMAGGDLVAQAFAEGLAATGPTAAAASAGMTFAPPSAQALPADLSGVVPQVVLETYNAALVGSSGPGVGPAATMEIGAEAGSMAEFTLLDPTVIHFGKGSARLSTRDKRRLGKLVRNYKSRGGVVSVIGHASRRTGDMDRGKHNFVNFEISLDRANAVSGELLRLGVSPGDLVQEARADQDPIYYEYMPAGEAGNQRVEIFLQ